jgi:hypothetical protein
VEAGAPAALETVVVFSGRITKYCDDGKAFSYIQHLLRSYFFSFIKP